MDGPRVLLELGWGGVLWYGMVFTGMAKAWCGISDIVSLGRMAQKKERFIEPGIENAN